MPQRIETYFATLAALIRSAEVTDRAGRAVSLADGIVMVQQAAHAAHDRGNTIMFVGNGGSASIASHLAIDFCKNGELRARAFNDAAALTCLGNDLGYESVFARQIGFHAREGDLLVAISGSGASPNILAATASARDHRCGVITFSGFDATNDLRQRGDVNFYVRAREYGLVEVAHLSLCHAILDLDRGWGAAAAIPVSAMKAP